MMMLSGMLAVMFGVTACICYALLTDLSCDWRSGESVSQSEIRTVCNDMTFSDANANATSDIENCLPFHAVSLTTRDDRALSRI